MHACRFPRFIRIRDDKRPEDASGPDVICELYRKQTREMEPRQEQPTKSKLKSALDQQAQHAAAAEGDGSESDAGDNEADLSSEDEAHAETALKHEVDDAL